MSSRYLAKHVTGLKPSGIRKFFDIVATMDDVISLGIGEPDFTTPDSILEAGIHTLKAGEPHYTSNTGIYELREVVVHHLKNLYDVSYDPASEIVITVGVSEALYLAMNAILEPGDEVIILAGVAYREYLVRPIEEMGCHIEIPMKGLGIGQQLSWLKGHIE